MSTNGGKEFMRNLKNGMMMADYLLARGDKEILVVIDKVDERNKRIISNNYRFEWNKTDWTFSYEEEEVLSKEIKKVYIENDLLVLSKYEKNVKIVIEDM